MTCRRGTVHIVLVAIGITTISACLLAQTAVPAPLVATAFGDADPSRPYVALQEPKTPRLPHDHFARAYLGDGLLGIRPNPNPLSQAETVAAGYVFSNPVGGFEMAAPAPYPLGADIRVGSASLLNDSAEVRIERQTLDMAHGELVTEMTFAPAGGSRIELRVTQFAVREVPSLLCEQIEITSSQDGVVEIVPQIQHQGAPGTIYRDEIPGTNKEVSFVLGMESDRHSRIGEAVVVTPSEDLERGTGGVFRFTLQEKRTVSVRIIAAIVTSAYDPQPDLQAIRVAGWGAMLGWDALRAENRAAWSELWRSRIVVDGDPASQRALDAAFFYLHSSVHKDLLTGVPPFGMSQWADYAGHVFWDMDSWDLPAVVTADPEAARAMVLYRARGLPAAERKASTFGMDGAMYPWEAGLDGSEQTPSEAETGWAEQHIVPDVAVSAWEYYEATGDKQTLREAVWPILRAVADWIVHRGTFTKRGFEISHVMGHNEWVANVSNDSMVNLLCRMALRDAITAAKAIGEAPRPEWSTIERAIYLPQDSTRKIIEPFSHDGPLTYFNESKNRFEEVDLSEHPEAYTLNNTQILVFHDPPIAPELYRNTWNYEETLRAKRVASPSVPGSVRSPGFSIPPLAACAAMFDDRKEAAELFHLAAAEYVTGPFDIPKEYRPYNDGAYITNNASLLMAALYGFTGMRISEDDWRKYPVSLPTGWQRIKIDRIWIKGHPWHLTAEQGKPLVLTPAAETPQPHPSVAASQRKVETSQEAHHAPRVH
jgi:trehalose/maltose hydrolase-like predicted phosphorylase